MGNGKIVAAAIGTAAGLTVSIASALHHTPPQEESLFRQRYKKSAVVVAALENGMVWLEDGNGKKIWYSSDGTFSVGDVVSITMDNMGTNDLSDDKILAVRTGGYLPAEKIAEESDTESPAPESGPEKNQPETYIVEFGDTLWGLAEKYYGDGKKFPALYYANAETLDVSAKRWGYPDADLGNVLYPGTELEIPEK